LNLGKKILNFYKNSKFKIGQFKNTEKSTFFFGLKKKTLGFWQELCSEISFFAIL